MTLKTITNSDLDGLEQLADKQGWDQIKHMVRDEQQVRQ